MERLTIFGAGHVGATTAFYLATSSDVEIRLVDVAGGKARGLAMDIGQALSYTGSASTLEGGDDPHMVEDSDLVVVTAGYPRTPGMSRLDLLEKNAPIVSSIARDVARWAPGAVVIVVTNPVDEMTYLCWQDGGLPVARVMGMAGVLDTSRFLYFLRRGTDGPTQRLEAVVLGTHGDDMVPLADSSTLDDRPLSEAFDPDVLDEAVSRTRNAGAEIVGYLGTGSAYFAPAVSIGVMANAVLDDTGEVLPASSYLGGEYGINGVFLGVPTRLGSSGVVEIVELPLSSSELEKLRSAARGVKQRISELGRVVSDENT